MFITRNANWKSHPLIYVVGFYLLYSLNSSVLAAVTLVTGGSQEIPAGTASNDIIFKVLDDTGNPDTGTTTNLSIKIKVKFSLVGPSGETITNGLSTMLADSDNSGQVSTRLNATPEIGIYTITASLINDSTQFASTYVIVVAGPPASLVESSGGNQVLKAGGASEPITFRLIDAFGNSLADYFINFTLKLPSGEVIGSNLSPPQAKTDTQGQVSTQVEGLTEEGEYTVMAQWLEDAKVVNTTTVQVKPQMPDFPSLGFGGAFDATGFSVDTDAVFHGGIATNEGDFEPEVVLTLGDTVAIEGVIKTDSHHLGQQADIVVVAGYLLPDSTNELYYMLDNMGNYQRWNGKIHELDSFKSAIKLPEEMVVKMYSGKLVAEGSLRIYFGYRLPEGTVVFNEKQTLNAVIEK